ncbi:MAG TPA: 3-deoxy-7-phosphoheptulonate synthase [Lutibacter sp.]|nr:3-deoxy-7-phosphoheptulonate synthase [Lutibacter sp.]
MENDKNIGNWLTEMNLGHPLTIAGPCSAETKEQVLEIAHQLKDNRVTVFRAGVWKPRTRPGSFEGVGADALPWLQQVKKETGLLIAIEVATANHVKLALEHDIDILWIGARTTANPFAVQEIADSLKDSDKIVWVKNPVNPDLELWIGGVERLYKAGVTNLGVIHRGFSTYKKTDYRNAPKWQIAIDFKTRFPSIPMINDPSHICGRRDCIENVAQKALDLQFDGVMIETHHDPDKAWSDAKQQITPNTLNEIITRLIVRAKTFKSEKAIDKLILLRKEINETDKILLKTLIERMEIVKKIAQVKKEKNVAVLQTKRWQQVIDKMTLLSKESGLDVRFVTRLFKEVHQESIRQQEKIVNKKK